MATFTSAALLSVVLVVGRLAGPTAALSTVSPFQRRGVARRAAAKQTTTMQVGVLGRLRRKRAVPVKPIEVGDAMPDVDVEDVAASFAAIQDAMAVDETSSESESGDKGASPNLPPSAAVSTRELFGPGTGTTVLFGLPGAFTPTCSDVHVPGFVRLADKFRAAGVETIACTSTNDRFVLGAWNASIASCVGVPNTFIRFLADGDGALADKLGLKEDMGFGVGVRTQRFALVVDDGTVRHVAVDPGMDVCDTTSAQSILAVVAPELAAEPAPGAGAAGGFALLLALSAAGYWAATHNPDLLTSIPFSNPSALPF